MKDVKILGTGCAKCQKLEANVKLAAGEFPGMFSISKETDINRIMSYGVMMTPGLVVEEKVVSFGRLLNVNEIKEILKKHI